METSVEKYNVYRTALVPLSQLNDFKVAKKYPDVRGWDIVGGDGEKLGKVKDLIVDVHQMKVRYLDVDLRKNILELKDDETYHILIPLGVAILNRDDHNVIVTEITKANLPNFPFYRREPIYVIRSYENAVLAFFENRQVPRDKGEFYQHKHFDDTGFYEPADKP